MASELKSAELEAEVQQCTGTGTVGHLSELSKTDLGGSHRVAMFIDESKPNAPSETAPEMPSGMDSDPYPHERVTKGA